MLRQVDEAQQNVDIEIAADERKHLILTGKNGSGKTSLIRALVFYFNRSFESDRIWDAKKECLCGRRFLDTNRPDEVFKDNLKVGINIGAKDMKSMLKKQKGHTGLSDITSNKLFAGHLFKYMPAVRLQRPETPNAIVKVNLDENVSANDFLSYMLDLNYQLINAIANNDEAVVQNITTWFDNFKNMLRRIYDCPELDLLHEPKKDYNFRISIPGREIFGLNEMADGYTSFLQILLELMMSMESKASMAYDIPGIVFIDEIEAHLHVELQRLVLPFLTEMFPRIQFIVTTHSPFVISSIPNALVYDLERQEGVKDMWGYSYDAIIEHYFGINKYSLEANKQFEIYNSLYNIDIEKRTNDETDRFAEAIFFLNTIPSSAAPELFSTFHRMEAERKGRILNGQT